MKLISLNCPNCGAPLQIQQQQTQTVCLYCSSTLRLQTSAAVPQARVETTLTAEDMEQLKQLLLSGQRDEAARWYQQQSGVSLTDTQEMLDDLVRQISLKTILRQPLSTFGMVLVVVCSVAVVIVTVAGVRGLLHPWIALGVVGYALIQLKILAPALLKTLKFWPAKIAPARVIRFAPIGSTQFRGTEVHTFKVLVEVQPYQNHPFEAEMYMPVRAKNLSRFHKDTVFQVKYLASNPPQLIFHQTAEDDDQQA